VVGSTVPDAATDCEIVPGPTVTNRVAATAATGLAERVFAQVIPPAATSNTTTATTAIRRRLSHPPRPTRDIQAERPFDRPPRPKNRRVWLAEQALLRSAYLQTTGVRGPRPILRPCILGPLRRLGCSLMRHQVSLSSIRSVEITIVKPETTIVKPKTTRVKQRWFCLPISWSGSIPPAASGFRRGWR